MKKSTINLATARRVSTVLNVKNEFCGCGRKVTGDTFYQDHYACFYCHMC